MKRSACARVMDQTERARALVRQAASLRRRGALRRALLALREACHVDEANAAHWMIYGALARRMGKRPEAERAMRQALWLRQRLGDKPRIRVICQQLLLLASA